MPHFLKILLEILKVAGWITLLIFLWFSKHPEYGEKILYYLIKLLPFVFSWKKRKMIEKEIEAYVPEEIKIVNSQTFGYNIFNKGIKIKWWPPKEEVIIGENEIIIHLGSKVNPCENFIDALMLYIENSFLKNERIYLDPSLYEASKFQIAISMLKKRQEKYFAVFMDKYYQPILEKYKEKLLTYSNQLEDIEKNGLFIPIFIPTILYHSEKLIYQRKIPSSQIRQEFNDFLQFLHNIAIKKEYEREKEEEPPLTFKGNFLKVSVILVARKELSEKAEYRPHLEKAKEKLREVNILFITGRGKRNSDLAELVALKLKQEDPFAIQINGPSKFNFITEEGKKIECLCFAFERKI
ncbi:MAG: hypothetical protein ABIK90_00910 [candidate division WOR-3 bacterium]